MLAEARDALSAELRALGLVVADDPAQAAAPVVIVDTPDGSRDGVTWSVEWPVLVLHRAPVGARALADTLHRVDVILAGIAGCTGFAPIAADLATEPSPGYVVTVTRRYSVTCTPTPTP